MIWLAVAMAGGLGAGARFVLDHIVTVHVGSRFPWGTWLVNVTGSALAGFITGLALTGRVGPELRIVIAGGFLGAYTTFSTAMVQAVTHAEAGRVPTALVSLLTTLIVTVGSAWVGLAWGLSV